MNLRFVPVSLINPAFITVKIELIHPEYDLNIFRLPLFLIRISVFHSEALHHAAAPRIIYIMSRCNIRNSVSQQLFDNCLPGFRSMKSAGFWRRCVPPCRLSRWSRNRLGRGRGGEESIQRLQACSVPSGSS